MIFTSLYNVFTQFNKSLSSVGWYEPVQPVIPRVYHRYLTPALSKKIYGDISSGGAEPVEETLTLQGMNYIGGVMCLTESLEITALT